MWKELVSNEVWYTENFIKENAVDKILNKINSAETKVLDGNEQPHIISKSHYNYNHVKYNVREDSGVVAQIIVKLNEVLEVVHRPLHIQDIDENNVLQFTTKTFNRDSIYNVHTERKDIYGDFVFVNYLTNEEGGELVFPDEFMLNKHFEEYPKERTNWLEFKRKLAEANQDPYLVGPLVIKPKRNSCVMMRVGSAHYVNPVVNGKPGCRAVITGWPFAGMNWKEKFNV
tara:strand:+ start:1247 stop:1933 length:687 start_codon:yes stop_codon:yes gene_type:complete